MAFWRQDPRSEIGSLVPHKWGLVPHKIVLAPCPVPVHSSWKWESQPGLLKITLARSVHNCLKGEVQIVAAEK